MTTDEQPTPKVDLAGEPDFVLGGLQVSPSACRIRAAGLDERVEPRVMEVLVVLARAAGATVTRDQLVDACWEGRIVSEDAITRIVAKVRALSRQLDPPPFELETIPKVGFRLIGGSGPAPALHAESAAPSERPPLLRRRPVRIAALVLVLVALVGAGLAVWRLRAAPGPGAPPTTEVMALDARGSGLELQRLAASIGDTTIRTLLKVGMEITPRLGRPDAATGGAAATFRITGSVDQQGETYVANMQLLDRASGLILWSARVERPAAAAAGFDEEVALAMAATLQCAFEDRRRFRQPMAPTVFALYLSACDSVAREGNSQRMLTAARRLVEAAPDEPTAHAMYAIAQAQVAAMTDFAPAGEVAALRNGSRASAERALALEPATPKAHLALANLARPPAWQERERHLLEAQRIDPGMGPGTITYLFLLREVGRLNEAQEAARRAAEAGDARVHTAVRVFATFLAAQTGDLDAARASIAETRRSNPSNADSLEFTVEAWWNPDLRAARDAVRRLAQNPTERACLEAHLDNVERKAAAGLPAACIRTAKDWRIRMLARQGEIDAAYAEVAGPIPNSRRTTVLYFYPEMKAFRADPRFMPLAKRMGLVDYWLASGHWPDFCAEPDLPYDCRQAARSLAARRELRTAIGS